jgi:hypothetical protein
VQNGVIYHCFRGTHPEWLNQVIAAVQAVPHNIFRGTSGQSLGMNVGQFDTIVYKNLSKLFGNSARVEQNVRLWQPQNKFDVDILLPTSPKTLIEIEKGKLPRLELDIIKIMSAILGKPQEYGYGCLIVPTNHIKLKLAGAQTPYQYVTEHLLPLAKSFLNVSDSKGGYLLRELCVVGYQDPRDIKPMN